MEVVKDEGRDQKDVISSETRKRKVKMVSSIYLCFLLCSITILNLG